MRRLKNLEKNKSKKIMKTNFIYLHKVGSWLVAGIMLLIGSTFSLAGTIKGKVVFEGTPPPPEKKEVTSDVTVCGTHQEVAKVIADASGGIRFAVVKLIDPKKKLPPTKPADGLLDQTQCQFEPHVQIIPLGSKLIITSSDTVLHNAHGFSEDGSDVFNVAVPVKGMKIPVDLTKKPGRVKLRCDAGHAWMRGYIVVAEHNYYVVTDPTGAFEFKDVPPGEYTIEVWHENLGVQQKKVTVTADGVVETPFTFSSKSLTPSAK